MVIINPGSGPVHAATEQHAKTNLDTLNLDLIDRGHAAQVTSESLEDQGDGRWRGIMVVDGHRYEVDMPGLPIEQVRFLGQAGQSIWDFPRLYVDGSSWVWLYALEVFTPDDE